MTHCDYIYTRLLYVRDHALADLAARFGNVLLSLQEDP